MTSMFDIGRSRIEASGGLEVARFNGGRGNDNRPAASVVSGKCGRVGRTVRVGLPNRNKPTQMCCSLYVVCL